MSDPRLIPELSAEDIQRFFSYIDKKDLSQCWIWQKSLTKDGYGKFYIGKERYPAHRISYYIHYGQPPVDRVLDHICHDLKCTIQTNLTKELCLHRRCVNPTHLVSTSFGENASRTNKFTQIYCNNRHLRTEENTRVNSNGSIRCKTCEKETAIRNHERRTQRRHELKTNNSMTIKKLDQEQASLIRELFNKGNVTKAELARQFQITDSSVRAILDNKVYIGNSKPKINETIATQIRIDFINGMNRQDLKTKYNLSQTGIADVIMNRSWQDLNYTAGIGFKD